jgi:hypothetical protein
MADAEVGTKAAETDGVEAIGVEDRQRHVDHMLDVKECPAPRPVARSHCQKGRSSRLTIKTLRCKYYGIKFNVGQRTP